MTPTTLERKRATVEVINGGANRGARQNLQYMRRFNDSSELYQLVPTYVDPIPGRAQTLVAEAGSRGLQANWREGTIESFLGQLPADGQGPLVLNIDRPAMVARSIQSSIPKRMPVESALFYACGYGSLAAARFLLDRGLDPAARNEKGETPLHWACWGPEPEAIKLLLERGAPVCAKDDRFHATPLEMALWTWNNTPEEQVRQRCYEAVALLVRAGAKFDPDNWRDPQQHSTVLDKINSDFRMQKALRGERSR